MLFLKKIKNIKGGKENGAFLPFLPRSKDNDDERRRNAFSATSLSITLPNLLKAKETDRLLPRAQKESERRRKLLKNTAKAALFPTTKNNKKIRNYLDRISLPRRSRLPFPVPSRLCSLYARACVVSGRTVSVLKGEGGRKVNTHAKSVSFFYKLIPSGMRELGEGNPFELGESRFIYQIYI